jgi:energy-coupling factor transporter ATP-binding protein EcfA2
VAQVPAVEDPGPFAGFKVILDNPAEDPGLRFADYATALSQVATGSQARFAIGIFGRWGSGKTTLMRLMQRQLKDNENVVTVWFSAWRYEKEAHLIVPLLDVLRDELEVKAGSDEGWARKAANLVARSGRAFLAALTISGGAAGVQGTFEFEKFAQAFGNGTGQVPLSFYHEGFVNLTEAIGVLAGEDHTRRVVIFVDDLDRCLPLNALDVLESMKLFFDEKGCVFVVGLDREIAAKAVEAAYGAAGEPGVSGDEYVKKIFQVPFNLPKVSDELLPEYLNLIRDNSELGDDQRDDIDKNVRRHFAYLRDDGWINPREIKRLINSYTLQLKMLWPTLRDSLWRDAVLGLLCLNARSDWQDFYNLLVADPGVSQSAIKKAVKSGDGTVVLAGVNLTVPPRLREYLSEAAEPLLRVKDLRSYVMAAESAWAGEPWVTEARVLVTGLRRSARGLFAASPQPSGSALEFRGQLADLRDLIASHRQPFGILREIRQAVDEASSDLDAMVVALIERPDVPPDDEWQAIVTARLDSIDAGLRRMYRITAFGVS